MDGQHDPADSSTTERKRARPQAHPRLGHGRQHVRATVGRASQAGPSETGARAGRPPDRQRNRLRIPQCARHGGRMAALPRSDARQRVRSHLPGRYAVEDYRPGRHRCGSKPQRQSGGSRECRDHQSRTAVVEQSACSHRQIELKSGRNHGGTGTDSSTEDTLRFKGRAGGIRTAAEGLVRKFSWRSPAIGGRQKS